MAEPLKQPYVIEIYEHADGTWGYRFKRKGRILFSTEGYNTKYNAHRALQNHTKHFAELVQLDGKFDIRYLQYEEKTRWKRRRLPRKREILLQRSDNGSQS
jgi:uncharacterized protein YegP (UPF0339 family)